MGAHRRLVHGRKDANHQSIIKAFRAHGWAVKDVSMVPGFVDIIVARAGSDNVLIEIKDGNKARSKQKLTAAEKEFHDRWPTRPMTVRSIGDVSAIHRGWCATHKT